MTHHDAAAILTNQLKSKDAALLKIREAAAGNDFWLDDLKAYAEGKELVDKLYWALRENNANIRKLAEGAL